MRNSVKLSVVAPVAAFALLASSAFADVLQLVPGGRAIENIPISSGAAATVGGRHFNLTTVGAGLRSKRVAIVNVRVYVAQLLVSDPSKFARTPDGALDSVGGMSQVAMRMDFLRAVDVATIESSFREALLANQVDLGSPAVQTLLSMVAAGGDALEGRSLTVVGENFSDMTEALTYENSQGQATTMAGPAGLIRAVFSMWLGQPTDSGIANLKKALIGG